MPSSSLDSKHSSHSPLKRSNVRDSSSDSLDRDSPHRQGKDSLRRQSRDLSHRQRTGEMKGEQRKRQRRDSRHQKRSRSRQRHHKRHHREKHDQKEDHWQGNQHSQGKDHFDLSLYDHTYFIEDQNAPVSIETAIWSAVINYGLRPKKTLIICENEKKLTRLIKSTNINREMIVIDQDSKEDIRQLAKSHDILLMTQEKSSITLGLDQGEIQIFDLIVNCGKTYSIQFYSLLPQFLGDNGIIFTVFEDKKQLERHQRKLKIPFKETNGQMHPNDIQKEIFNEIQFSKKINNSPNLDDLSLLKTLPYSLEETALKLFALVKDKYQPKKSVYLQRQGHSTFCLKTDTEFNSIKYIWNFIREEMPPNVVKNIKDMKKFQNQRGVLFNVPISDLSKWQTLESKIRKGDKKYKGYKFYEFINQELPKLQDTESQEYKLLQQKKDEALKNRNKLEIFIAGVPYDANQVDIRKYFAQHEVNLFLIRILRDSSGFSKGIAFGLAENQLHFQRAMQLNGQKFGDRQLRVKLADQREK